MNIVNESGLYDLIFQSRKPEARAFRRWITSDVLPQLRKTGVAVSDSLPEWARQQIATIEAEQQRQSEQLRRIAARVDGIEGRHDWFSALAYARVAHYGVNQWPQWVWDEAAAVDDPETVALKILARELGAR